MKDFKLFFYDSVLASRLDVPLERENECEFTLYKAKMWIYRKNPGLNNWSEIVVNLYGRSFRKISER